MMDMICIIFVHAVNIADDTIVNLAAQRNIAILQTPYSMFTGLRYVVSTRSQRQGVKAMTSLPLHFTVLGDDFTCAGEASSKE